MPRPPKKAPDSYVAYLDGSSQVPAEGPIPAENNGEGGHGAPFIPSTMVPSINALSVGKIVYLRVEAEVVKGGAIVRAAGLLR